MTRTQKILLCGWTAVLMVLAFLFVATANWIACVVAWSEWRYERVETLRLRGGWQLAWELTMLAWRESRNEL